MQTVISKKPKTLVPDVKKMTVAEQITFLQGINESRIKALGYYPKMVKQYKWDAVNKIRYELFRMADFMNERQQVLEILRLENHFLAVQPLYTSNLRATYLKKINDVMDQCRAYLGRQKQRA